jgi:3-methyl-2-oxobutanoate hydroxymethyltransferase
MPTILELQNLKQRGRKIVGLVTWDYSMARAADRAGVDIISVGEIPRVQLQDQMPQEINLDELLVVCAAVRRGVTRALVSVDLPAHEQNVAAALRLQKCGAEMVKLIGSAELVRGVVRAGVPVLAEFHGGKDETPMLVDHARRLEDAGASLLDFRHSGPAAGEAVARAVRIPVIGGPGAGPWLDGCYASFAQITLEGLSAYAQDVRSGKQARVRP